MNYYSELDPVTVLIVDDQAISRSIFSQILRELGPGVKTNEAASPIAALQWAKEFIADMLIVDYEMPGMNGVDFVKEIRELPQYQAIPILMITIKTEAKIKYEALDAGVTDFLTKPVDIQECIARCRNLITLRRQQIFLEDKSRLLEAMVNKKTEEISIREKETLMRLARAGEYRDSDTAKHLIRMSIYSRLVAEALGLSVEEAELIELASPLHDLGKIGIPDSILLKKGPLTPEETKIMQQHPLIGFEILEGSPSKYLQKGSEIALGHHEKFDGSGYPYGLSGEAIPLSARIVAIADVFDALTSVRPYKEAWSFEKAFQYLASSSGAHFDPQIVEAMLSIKDSLALVQNQYPSFHIKK